jgi:hypothetical protein
MITATRREILKALEELSDLNPDIRLGQLMANLSYLARGPAVESIWDMEDEELLAAAKKHLERMRGTQVSVA